MSRVSLGYRGCFTLVYFVSFAARDGTTTTLLFPSCCNDSRLELAIMRVEMARHISLRTLRSACSRRSKQSTHHLPLILVRSSPAPSPGPFPFPTSSPLRPASVSASSSSSSAPTRPPRDYDELVEQLQRATVAAVDAGEELIEIEFPPSGLASVPGDAEGANEMTYNMDYLKVDHEI